MAKTIALGHKVRDTVSGIVGIATSEHWEINNQHRFGVQPPVTKKEPEKHPEALIFDAQQLAYVGPGRLSIVTKPSGDNGITLGDEVEEVTTGFKGIAISRNVYLNGCVMFYVDGKSEAGKKPEKGKNCAAQLLKRVSDGVTKHLATTPEKPKGGPPMRISELND
jgi:hypothetical protein